MIIRAAQGVTAPIISQFHPVLQCRITIDVLQSRIKRKTNGSSCVIVKLLHKTRTAMNTATQTMKFRQSLLSYAEKHGVTQAAIKYNVNRQYIYRWKRRYNGDTRQGTMARSSVPTARITNTSMLTTNSTRLRTSKGN